MKKEHNILEKEMIADAKEAAKDKKLAEKGKLKAKRMNRDQEFIKSINELGSSPAQF